MIDGLCNYLVSIVSVCMIAAIAGAFVKQATVAQVVKIVSGILILATVLAPLVELDIDSLTDAMQGGFSEDTATVDEAMEQSRLRMMQQVQAATEAHIEQIALHKGYDIQVRVQVSEDDLPVPVGVELIGLLQPEAMTELSEYIETNLAIPKSKQIWRLYEANE